MPKIRIVRQGVAFLQGLVKILKYLKKKSLLMPVEGESKRIQENSVTNVTSFIIKYANYIMQIIMLIGSDILC